MRSKSSTPRSSTGTDSSVHSDNNGSNHARLKRAQAAVRFLEDQLRASEQRVAVLESRLADSNAAVTALSLRLAQDDKALDKAQKVLQETEALIGSARPSPSPPRTVSPLPRAPTPILPDPVVRRVIPSLKFPGRQEQIARLADQHASAGRASISSRLGPGFQPAAGPSSSQGNSRRRSRSPVASRRSGPYRG
jgi:uncharacterized coiled-coil protein SlyX